jgi:hypothetical protein
MKFMIYAMPRSGSTWLANFLTADGLVCHHDPLGRMSPEQASKLDAAVDTGAYLFQRRITAEKSYALIRRLGDCNRSLAMLGLPQIAEYQRLVVPTFYYERLFDVGYLAELWSIVRGPGFDKERAEVLIDVNIQHRLDRILEAPWLGSAQ